MKKNFLSKVLAFVGVAALVMSMTTTAAFAGTTYTPVAGTSTTFQKFLIMDSGDSVPNATFAFTVAPGTARPAASGKMAVLAGVGSPTIANVTFAPGDTTATSAGTNIDVARAASDRAAGLTAATGVELEAGEKFAQKTATVDFSSVTFPEPGVYRYIISETASAEHAAAGIMHDNDTDRVLDVYVTDDGTGTLVVSSYVMHKNDADVTAGTDLGSDDVAQDAEALSDKTDGFTNEYNAKDLKVSKTVSGNQASRDKYFEITVTMTDVADADSYVVSLANDNDTSTVEDGNADATSGTTTATIEANRGKTNPTTVTGAQLKAGQKFYLQHGQDIVIRGIAPNASYTVTENNEDYKSTLMTGKTNSGVIGTVAGNEKTAQAGFTNVRNGTIPTGVVMNAATGIAVMAIAGALMIFMLAKKKANGSNA